MDGGGTFAGTLGHCPWCGKPCPSPPALSLLLPLLAEHGSVPAGRGETFQGPGSILTEKAKRVPLEVWPPKV